MRRKRTRRFAPPRSAARRQRRPRPEQRPAPAVRTDLEARRRLADAVRGTGSGQRRGNRRQGNKLRATGSIIAFDGFLKLYREDSDDDAPGATAEEDNRMLPPMAERDPLRRGDVTALQHFTQPPPRYSEASLVKENGGTRHRPPLHLCLDSVGAAGPQIRPAGKATLHSGGPRPLVTAFLVSFFEHYVNTASPPRWRKSSTTSPPASSTGDR